MASAPVADLAYTYAVDLCGENQKAVALTRDLLRDVRKSGLKPPFSAALLRRLALAEWTKRDRPRPSRLDSHDSKEWAILHFFWKSWGARYEDLAVALQVSEDRARHLVHRARMEQVATLARVPRPKPGCRHPRELLSDYQEGRLPDFLSDDVTQHLEGCGECATLAQHLLTVFATPGRRVLEAPGAILGAGDNPGLPLPQDGTSRAKRRAGAALLAAGVLLSVVQLHPGLNASAAAQMDRMGATLSRWRGRAARLMEDLRVLKALTVGTVEGRTEELSQTLEEYVNSGNPLETSDAKNKPAPDAVLNGRDPKTVPQDRESPGPVEGSLSPKNP